MYSSSISASIVTGRATTGYDQARSPDEQKVRLDKEQEKVALRPGPSRPQADAQLSLGHGPRSDADDTESDHEKRKKTQASPDTSSFQEVEL